MKRFSKIAMSVATVSAMAAAMAISASAMTAEYAEPTGTETGKVNLTGVTATGAHQTVLVLNAVNLQKIAADNIVQIDQKDDGTSFVSVPVGELTKGTTYEVRIGGNGTVQTATFPVGGQDTVDIVVGDATGDGWADLDDCSAVFDYYMDGIQNADGTIEVSFTSANDPNVAYVIGDATGDGWADLDDCSAVFDYYMDGIQNADGSIETTVKVIVNK